MLTNLIEGRGKEFSNLLKIGDYLGRSLRENVELFFVENGRVTYLTESNKVIGANYSFKPILKLVNITVDDSSILENSEAFEKITNRKVSTLLSNLLESDYQNAESSFDEILNLYETKLSYDRIKERLREKTERFGEQTKIVSSPQFQKVSELKDKLVEFLKANKGIANIPEIKNGLKLASVVSKSFNLPRLTVESLAKDKTFAIKTPNQNTIYEHLCRQELIAKELLEAKQHFDTTWANNELINELVTLIYENDNSRVEKQVAQIVSQIPYFALATKKQLNSLVSNSIALSESDVPTKDITSYVSKIYEMKKPVKDFIITLLNEKYGININNLTDIPTFTNLLKTETVILSSLAKLAPKNSILKQTLSELADSLKIKNGSESIDVVDFLNEVFNEAGYKSVINETSLMQYLDFNQVADDLGKIGTILKLIRPMVQGGGAPPMGGAGATGAVPPMGGAMGGQTPPITDPLPDLEQDGLGQDGLEDGGMPPQDGEGNPMEAPMGDAEDAAGEVGMEDEMGGAIGGEVDPGIEGGENGAMDGEMGMDDMGQGAPMEDPQEPVEQVQGDDITKLVSDIEDLLSSIKSEIGDTGEVSDGEDSEFEEDFNPGEGNGEAPSPDAAKGDFDGGGESEGSNEDEPSDDKPEQEPKKKVPFKK